MGFTGTLLMWFNSLLWSQHPAHCPPLWGLKTLQSRLDQSVSPSLDVASGAPRNSSAHALLGSPYCCGTSPSHQILIQVHFWLGKHHWGLSHDRASGELAGHRKLTGFHDQKPFLRHPVVYSVVSGCQQLNKTKLALRSPQHTAQFREDFGTELLDFIFGWFRN